VSGRLVTMSTLLPITDEDLLRLPHDGRKRELVDGGIRLSPAGGRHGQISVELLVRIHAFVRERRLGVVFDSSTGFRIPGRQVGQQDVRSPDVSFVAAGRLPGERAPAGFVELAPDLAVEVLSPDDRRREVLEKVGEFLDAGTRQVWVLDPEERTAAVYRSLTDVRRLGESDSLDGGDVLPGFTCALRDIFGLA
jgi:Uma2 family endonuclease